MPPAVGVVGEDQRTQVELFDADGAHVNTIEVSCADKSGVILVELEPMMSACKLESGMKHGHITVRSPFPATHFMRVISRDCSTLTAPLLPLSSSEMTFFPVTFARGRAPYVCVVNFGEGSEAPLHVRARVYHGKRAPEAVILVPPRSTRIFNLSAICANILAEAQSGKEAELQDSEPRPDEGLASSQAYVRLSLREEGRAGVQLIEYAQVGDDVHMITSIV